MRHEPLCPAYEHAENHEDTYWCTDECDLAECFCDSIAEIRADERRQAVERVRAKKGKFPSTRLDWGTIADAILDGTKLRLSKEEQAEIYGT